MLRLEDDNAFSNEFVSVIPKLGLVLSLNSHTLNNSQTGDLVPRYQPRFLL